MNYCYILFITWAVFLSILVLGIALWVFLIRTYLFPIQVSSVDLTDPAYELWVCGEPKIKEIYKTYEKVRNILEEHNYVHWLGYGSLLGCGRHNGIIPWDDDIDLVVIVENQSQQNALENLLLKYFPNSQLEKMGFGIQINDCVDLFYYSYRQDIHKYQIRNRIMYLLEKTEKDRHSFSKKELYPLKKVPFGTSYAWVPNKHIQVLDRVYPRWDKHAMIQIPHQVSVHSNDLKERIYRSALRYALNHKIKVTMKDISGQTIEINSQQ